MDPRQGKLTFSGAGKSSLTVQYCEGHFVESYYPTIENTFSHEIVYKSQTFLTEIIDTAGQVWKPRKSRARRSADMWKQDEYSLMNSKLYIGIHGYLIVYSVASRQSFDMVRIIRDKLLNHLVWPIPLQSPRVAGLGLTPAARAPNPYPS